jgi:hypothetical protein
MAWDGKLTTLSFFAIYDSLVFALGLQVDVLRQATGLLRQESQI